MNPELETALQALANQFNVELVGVYKPVVPPAGQGFDLKPIPPA